LTGLCAKIRDAGGSALVLDADVTDEEQARGAVERTVAEQIPVECPPPGGAGCMTGG